MRGRIFAFTGLSFLVCVGVFATGCGGKKAAKDPTDDSKPTYTDDTTKWEGASAEDQKPAKTGGSSSGGDTSSTPSTSGTSTTGSSGGAIQEAPKRRTDTYDKEATEIALKRAARQVKANCGAAKDDNGKAVGPWGKATVQVMLGHNGHSKGTTVPAPYQGKVTGNCVEKAFTNLTYPPWGGADTQVDWDIEIVEPGKEAAAASK